MDDSVQEVSSYFVSRRVMMISPVDPVSTAVGIVLVTTFVPLITLPVVSYVVF
ncbi:hypothetical protein [Clostridium acidisoli]|uniref:hypothetical protein n=1 Tax=Clostridium acidisoli TaxID=91624 RepID=UPI0015947B71|nr:hypothetical protein [Clostridium acidisoli]